MVKVTPITEASAQKDEKAFTAENDNDFTDVGSDSEVSDADDDDYVDETLAERLIALRDVIPPEYRSSVASTTSTVFTSVKSSVAVGGKLMWAVITSSLLLGVPLSLSILSEQQLSEMEKEMKVNQSTNDILAPGAEGSFQQPVVPGAVAN